MEDQYGMPDLRHYLAAGSFELFPPQTPSDLLAAHRGMSFATPASHPYVNNMLVAHGSNGGVARTGSASGGDLIEFKMDAGGVIGGGDGGTVRWPRQETLALLEIRSKLDSKFKEANQKVPLWEEVSRIMFEEHGYQRSGKKCREKFENLYKYYKKTKEAKAGRQDGKHYRFFRQLEALYGGVESSNSAAAVPETNFVVSNPYSFRNEDISLANHNHDCYNLNPKLSDTSIISLSNSFNSETTSSEYYNDFNVGVLDINDQNKLKKRKGKIRSFKAKIRNHIDAQMRAVMEKQEVWMEKMMRNIESKEQERIEREEEWRKQDSARIEIEHRLWAKERNWIKMRDAALMNAVQMLTGNELSMTMTSSLPDKPMGAAEVTDWPECETTTWKVNGMEAKFDQGSHVGYNVENDHGNGNVVSDGFFRYLLGDGHGRII